MSWLLVLLNSAGLGSALSRPGPSGVWLMGLRAAPCGPLLLCLALLVVSLVPPLAAWDEDLELLDLVEEIPQTFYQFLSVEQVRATTCCCIHGNRLAVPSRSPIFGWVPRVHGEEHLG